MAGLLAGAGLAGCTGAGGEVPVTAEPPPPGIATEAGAGGSDGGSGSTPAASVSIVDFGGRAGPDDSLVATVTVENESDRQAVRLVRATVTVDDTQTTGERFVRLPPRERRTVRIHVDVSFEAWSERGSLSPQVIARTPATPIPTDRETPTDTAVRDSPTPTPGDDTRSGTATGTDSDTDTGTPPGTATGTDTRTPSGTATE